MAEVKRGSPLLEKTGITILFIICLTVFTYTRFPFDVFRGRLENTISSMIGRQVVLGHVHSRLLFGFRVDSMSINNVVIAKDLILKPHFISLLTGRVGMDVKALFPSGSLACSFDKPYGSTKRPVYAKVKMDNFDSALIHTLLATDFQPKGLISGSIDLMGPNTLLSEMSGKSNIVWNDGYFPLPGSQLPMDGLTFKVMEMNSRIEKGLLTLEKLELKGDMSGAMSGSIRMMDPFANSRLNLTGTMNLSPGSAPAMDAGLQQGIKFSLRGTLDRPRFRILGSPR